MGALLLASRLEFESRSNNRLLCTGFWRDSLLQLETDRIGSQLREQLASYIHKRVSDPSDAEDLQQDILLKVLSNQGPVEADKLVYWVFAIARNQVTDYYRSSARRKSTLLLNDEQLPAVDEEDISAGIKASLSEALSELIGELSEQDQHVLRTVDLDGMSQKEFALQQGLDYTTAKSRVQRARKRLRLALERCCEIELDRRGAPTSCKARENRDCC